MKRLVKERRDEEGGEGMALGGAEHMEYSI